MILSIAINVFKKWIMEIKQKSSCSTTCSTDANKSTLSVLETTMKIFRSTQLVILHKLKMASRKEREKTAPSNV